MAAAAPMAQMAQQFGFVNFDPVVPVIKRMMVDIDFKRFAATTMHCADSSALSNVLLASAKAVPYVIFNDEGWAQNFGNGLSCRVRYLECAVTSLAASVYHLVLGVAMTALTLVTIGKVQIIVDQMRKEWIHAGLAGGACVISFAGTANPETGMYMTGLGLLGLFRLITGDISTDIAIAYRQHNRELKQAVAQVCQQNNLNFDQQFGPIFRRLDEHFLSTRASDMMELVQVMIDVVEQFHIIPYASPEVLWNNLQQVISDTTHQERPEVRQERYVHT